MCTVSVISLASAQPHLAGDAGFRLVVNRDEQRDRPPALQPRWRTVGEEDSRRALWPIDPRGGGTWVGASETGLVLSLLNLNPDVPPMLPAQLVSRGAIIPRLLSAADPEGVLRRLERLELERFAPFRLVVAAPDRAGRFWGGGFTLHEATWDRERLSTRRVTSAPACFASSGLGDSRVTGRLELFDELVGRAPGADAQDRFHRHCWPGREEVSVLMSREDARTVSVTVVEVRPRSTVNGAQVRMNYRSVYEPAALALAATPRG